MNADQKQAQVAVRVFPITDLYQCHLCSSVAGFCFSISAILESWQFWQSLLIRGISVDQW